MRAPPVAPLVVFVALVVLVVPAVLVKARKTPSECVPMAAKANEPAAARQPTKSGSTARIKRIMNINQRHKADLEERSMSA